MKKENNNKQQFGDIIYNHDLKKHTIMVAGFPAMITSYVAGGKTLFKGFLPGFEFAQVEGIEDEAECVEYLQDMLDDEVEELVVFGKSLDEGFLEVENNKTGEKQQVKLDDFVNFCKNI